VSSPSRPQTEGGGSARSRSEMTRRLERALVFHDVILVVEEGTFYLSNNVAARSRHLLGGAVVLSARRSKQLRSQTPLRNAIRQKSAQDVH
jgi:hypothetical protein